MNNITPSAKKSKRKQPNEVNILRALITIFKDEELAIRITKTIMETSCSDNKMNNFMKK